MKNYKPATGEDLMRFEDYIITDDLQGMRDYFAEGYSPDICAGGGRWSSKNPLWRVCGGGNAINNNGNITVKDSYDKLAVLLEAGADVTLRPYIWHSLNVRILTEEEIAWLKEGGRTTNAIPLELVYKRLSLLIEYGADVDMKGAPDRFLLPWITHQQYFEEEGSYPIELAIRENLPSIVDLILAHSKIGLTEECIKIAEETNDPAMIEKIQRLWRKKNVEGAVREDSDCDGQRVISLKCYGAVKFASDRMYLLISVKAPIQRRQCF